MGQTKALASLSSTLLARKGHARPAMRPQGYTGFGAPTEPPEDLGWNDMGHGEAAAPVECLPRAPSLRDPVDLPPVPETPTLAASVTPPVIAPARERAAPGSKGKAAFTLRLDPVRHLRLRLASALGRRSAQQIVTQALDAYLQSLPDVEAAADRFGGQHGTKDSIGGITK